MVTGKGWKHELLSAAGHSGLAFIFNLPFGGAWWFSPWWCVFCAIIVGNYGLISRELWQMLKATPPDTTFGRNRLLDVLGGIPGSILCWGLFYGLGCWFS